MIVIRKLKGPLNIGVTSLLMMSQIYRGDYQIEDEFEGPTNEAAGPGDLLDRVRDS